MIWNVNADFVFLDEVDEGCSFDLDGLTLAVIERQDEVKEVALAKVARRLFLEVCSTDSQTEHITPTEYFTMQHVYSVSQKSSPPRETFCDIFTCGEPVWLKIITAIAQTYSYV